MIDAQLQLTPSLQVWTLKVYERYALHQQSWVKLSYEYILLNDCSKKLNHLWFYASYNLIAYNLIIIFSDSKVRQYIFNLRKEIYLLMEHFEFSLASELCVCVWKEVCVWGTFPCGFSKHLVANSEKIFSLEPVFGASWLEHPTPWTASQKSEKKSFCSHKHSQTDTHITELCTCEDAWGGMRLVATTESWTAYKVLAYSTLSHHHYTYTNTHTHTHVLLNCRGIRFQPLSIEMHCKHFHCSPAHIIIAGRG